ncbi:MAG: hypothetical protein Tsb002_34170 [Wenzhouxiangellaceae bacterium]
MAGNAQTGGSIAVSPLGGAFSGAGSQFSSANNAVQAYEKLQQQADTAFQDKHYGRAFTLYQKLAQYADWFAQYRLAQMYQLGLGTEADLIEAYAWSAAASESSNPELVAYHEQVRAALPESDRSQAQEKADHYRQEYGVYAVAYKAQVTIRREKRSCTGSRIGNTCDRITSSGTLCNGFNGGLPGDKCLTMGAVGLPSVVGMQPMDVREVYLGLRQVMEQYSPGQVELGELELIDDDE